MPSGPDCRYCGWENCRCDERRLAAEELNAAKRRDAYGRSRSEVKGSYMRRLQTGKAKAEQP